MDVFFVSDTPSNITASMQEPSLFVLESSLFVGTKGNSMLHSEMPQRFREINFEIKNQEKLPFFKVIDGCTQITTDFQISCGIIIVDCDYDFKIKKVIIYLCDCGKLIVNEWYGDDNFIEKSVPITDDLDKIRDSYRRVLRPLESSVVAIEGTWKYSSGNFVLDISKIKECKHEETTIKVVINDGLGGFGLSSLALKQLIEWDVDVDKLSRDHPLLVKVVEELGVRANGYCAYLKIIEIPNNTEWIIQDYDGEEWVAEVHRTWR